MLPGLVIMPDENGCRILGELLPEVTVRRQYQTGAWRFIVRFDGGGGDDDALVLNRASVLTGADWQSLAREHWRATSLRFTAAGKQPQFYKRFRVHVFDLKPIYMLRSEIGHRQPRRLSPFATQETRRVSEAAVRAVYTAGLDIAAVDMGMTGSNRLYVTAIDACPRLGKTLAKTYARQIRSWIERTRNHWSGFTSLISARPLQERAGYTLGADPEFALRDARTGRMVFASDFFPMRGVVGCDARRVKTGRSGFPLAEVRPAPSQCPLELADRIQQALKRANRLAAPRHIEWRAGTLPFNQLPVGGHIHFGMLPTGQLLRALDNYLAVLFLLLENPGAARARRRKYGWLGDYRLKSHGGFEYRVVPSWLVSPLYTRGALCLAKVIGTDWHLLETDLFVVPEARRAFRRADHSYFRARLPVLLEDIRSLPGYGEFRDPIEALFLALAEERSWKTGGDLKRSWGLRKRRRRGSS